MVQLTRRQALLGAGGTLLGAVTACGSGDSGQSAPGAKRTLTHRYGTTEISGKPERVVTVGLTEQDYVLALGAAPVAAREWFGGHPGALWPWARAKLGDADVPEVLPRKELDFEQIAALNPDLILGVNSGLTKQQYDTLSGMAPTVAQAKDHADYGAPWQTITRTVGAALGKPDEAESLISPIEQRFQRARAQHPEFGESTGLLATSISGEAYIYSAGPAPEFLRTLGFELPDDTAAAFSGKDRAPVQLSAERWDLLEADVLALGVYGDPSNSIANDPLFAELDVAKQGRYVSMPRQSSLNGSLSFSSVLSLPLALDEMVPRLAAALDGDPTTKVRPASE